MRLKSSSLWLALLLSVGTASSALAEDEDLQYDKADWPLQITQRPLVLAPSMLELRGDTFRLNMSAGQFAEPISFAPDLFFGVNRKLTVGVTHGTGICVTSDSCVETYNDIGLEAYWSLMGRGNFQVAVHGGFVFPAFSPDFAMGMSLGLLTRLQVGKVAVVLDPGIYVAFTQRDDDQHPTRLLLPVDLQYQINNQTAVMLRSGVSGPASGFGDGYQLPLALAAVFAINERLDFGAELGLTDIAGPTDAAGIDGRYFIGRMALRL